MRIPPQNIRPQTGFTIVELLIVIVVIGILAAITIVAFNGVQARAHLSTAKQDIASIKQALELYYVDNNTYPDSNSCVNTPGQTNHMNGWCGWDQGQGDSFIPGLSPKYISKIPTLPQSLPSTDTYLYQSGNQWSGGGGSGGVVTQYQLIRYRAPALGGLHEIERDANPDLLEGGSGGYNSTQAWGYRSEPTTGWW